MPIYFGEVAPHCPISRDQPVGPMQTPSIRVRTNIPRAHDLASAIAAVNILRSIVIQITSDRTINNVYTKSPPKQPKPDQDKTIDKTRLARWVERKELRVKRNYKYIGTDKNGKEDDEIYAIMERIEVMVWYDRAWKGYLVWRYGDKGEGTPA
jgi:hypothetical protein